MGAKTNDIIAKPGAAHFESMCYVILALFSALFRCFELILLGFLTLITCSPNADRLK